MKTVGRSSRFWETFMEREIIIYEKDYSLKLSFCWQSKDLRKFMVWIKQKLSRIRVHGCLLT